MSDLNKTQVGGTHYTSKTVQPWEAMQSWMSHDEFTGFLRGNVIKYIARCDEKGGIEDLRKARHYLDKLIGTLAEQNSVKPCPEQEKGEVKSVNKNPLWRLRMIMLERLILFVHGVDNRFCKTEDADSERELVFVTNVDNLEYIANRINSDAYVMGLKIESHSIELKNTKEEPYLSYLHLYGIAQPILVRIKFEELNQ